MTVEKIRFQPAIKCQVFVRHIQRHLNRGDTHVFQHLDRGHPIQRIPPREVGCKICEKGIEQIWEEERKGAKTSD